MSSTLNATETRSLPELVYQELRNAILNGTFVPGQMLRQEDVASKLGVSRSPLREALPKLEAEGIVVLHPRRGYAVALLDPEEISEVFDLRILLESELAARSIVRRTPADITKVYAILTEMAALAENAEQADRSKWFDLNNQFHNALLLPAKSPRHMQALEKCRSPIETSIRMEVNLTGDLRQAQQEHAGLAEAFVVGDRDRFIELIRSHSQHTKERLLKGLLAAHAAPEAPAKR